jgi:hypothetical protein
MRTRTLYATGVIAACTVHAAIGYALANALHQPRSVDAPLSEAADPEREFVRESAHG